MQGRRRQDLELDRLHDDVRPGDYWKILDRKSGEPLRIDSPTNLTGTSWFVVAPIGDEGGFAIGRLENHTVREHDDETISVRPHDGSSNSIEIAGAHGFKWHGYIEHGIWTSV